MLNQTFRVVAIFAAICSASVSGSASAQVSFTGDFEAGNLGSAIDMGNGLYQVRGYNHKEPSKNGFFINFKVSGVNGQTPRFQRSSTGLGGDTHRHHKMYYSYDGDSWTPMDSHEFDQNGNNYTFYNNSAFTQDNVQIAMVPVRTYTQTQNWITDTIAPSPYTKLHGNNGTVATSYEGRNVYGFSVTNPNIDNQHKKNVVVVAHQHGYEHVGKFATEGMANFLVSNDPVAKSLRDKAVFHFYPDANPDSTVNGWGREGKNRWGGWKDFNRDWNENVQHSFEIDGITDDIIDQTDGEAAFFLDIHTHSPKKGRWYWWATKTEDGLEAGVDGNGDGKVDYADFVKRVAEIDHTRNGEKEVLTIFEGLWNGIPDNRVREVSSKALAEGWGSDSLGALSFTLEPVTVQLVSGEPIDLLRMRQAGQTIALAIDEFLPNAVPEPASLALFGMSGVWLLLRRRTRV